MPNRPRSSLLKHNSWHASIDIKTAWSINRFGLSLFSSGFISLFVSVLFFIAEIIKAFFCVLFENNYLCTSKLAG